MILSYLYKKIPEESQEGVVAGLAFGLAFGLVAGLIDIITTSFQHSILVFFAILVISEMLYWLDKTQLDNDMGRWLFTLFKKGESILETSIIIVSLYLIVKYYDEAIDFIMSKGETVHMVLSIVGYGTIIVLVVIGYIWFNSLKYKQKK